MNEIVTYHNDLNKIRLPNFSEQEQNLLMGIISKVKENGEKITFYPEDLREFCTKNYTNIEFIDIIKVLRFKFFKADFTILLKDGNLKGEKTINLFKTFTTWYNKDDLTETKIFHHLDVAVNEEFLYILNDLTVNFTSFELAEFIGLNGKYAKTLYRLLKQFRSTGKVTIYSRNWDEFIEFMNIPKNYLPHNIDERVLKPALKELSAERNLFTNTVPIFENLTYKKIKDPKLRGRGGKIVGIEFYFEPEKQRTELSEQIKNLKKLNDNLEKDNQKEVETQIETPKIHPITGDTITDLTPYIGAYFSVENKFDKGRDSCKILELYNSPDGIYGLARNQENEKTFELSFKDLKHMKNALKLK